MSNGVLGFEPATVLVLAVNQGFSATGNIEPRFLSDSGTGIAAAFDWTFVPPRQRQAHPTATGLANWIVLGTSGHGFKFFNLVGEDRG